MPRRGTDTLDSYEDIPLDSPERRTIQNRNAQRVYRAKTTKRTRIEPPQPGKAVAQPAQPQRISSTSGSIVATPSPPPTLPEPQIGYNNRTTTLGPFAPPNHFDPGDNDLISRMLADDPNYSTLDASYADFPHDMESTSAGESGLVDTPGQFGSMLPGGHEPSQVSSRSATADLASSWDIGDFRPDFNLSYRPGENASMSANALTSLDAPPRRGPPNIVTVPQPLISPTTVPPRTSPRSPTSPKAPSYQSPAGTNPSTPSREEDQPGNRVWRHPIHTAAQHSHTRIIQLLLQSGCDVNLKDGTGSTPLHVAAAEGHVEVVQLLVKHGCDINSVDNHGWTPIHRATRNGHTECVELLLKLGCNVSFAQVKIADG